MMDGKREWDLLNKIGFVRLGGSQEELKAAHLLQEEIEAMGLSAQIQPFQVSAHQTQVEMLITPTSTYQVTAYAHCANTPASGLTAPFHYMELKGEVDKKLARGKIVLVNGYLNYDLYKTIVEAGAVGFITYSGENRDCWEESDLPVRELRKHFIALKNLPGVHLRVQDAMRLVRENPAEITLTVMQEESVGESRNVICEIPGSQEVEEVIVFTAHYDSVQFSQGVYDNGAGSVILLELLRYFKENPPRRTLRFIWCGSEERGLLGSHAYVDTCGDLLKNILFVINVDVAGPVLGTEQIMVMAELGLVYYIQYLAREVGYAADIKQSIYSSDAIPFADKGIPGINFTRFGITGTAYIHNRHDTLDFMSAESLEKTTQFILKFAQRTINSCVFPFIRKVPEEITKKVDEYLNKPRKEEK